MFTSSQQLADAKANGKIFLALAAAGAIAGAAIGPAIYFKTLPAAAQQVVTMSYIANFNLARVPAFSNARWLDTRENAHKKLPALAEQLDTFPAALGLGVAAGGVSMPLLIALLLSVKRSKKNTPTKNNKAGSRSLSDFLPR